MTLYKWIKKLILLQIIIVFKIIKLSNIYLLIFQIETKLVIEIDAEEQRGKYLY